MAFSAKELVFNRGNVDEACVADANTDVNSLTFVSMYRLSMTREVLVRQPKHINMFFRIPRAVIAFTKHNNSSGTTYILTSLDAATLSFMQHVDERCRTHIGSDASNFIGAVQIGNTPDEVVGSEEEETSLVPRLRIKCRYNNSMTINADTGLQFHLYKLDTNTRYTSAVGHDLHISFDGTWNIPRKISPTTPQTSGVTWTLMGGLFSDITLS